MKIYYEEYSSTIAVDIYILGIVLWTSIVSERPIVKCNDNNLKQEQDRF